MKLLTFGFLLLSLSAFAQQQDKPVKLSGYDSLDFDWNRELFLQWDCYCPWLNPEAVQSMPRELSPYKFTNKEQRIFIDDSTYQEWIKADQRFEKMFQKPDSLQLKNKKPALL